MNQSERKSICIIVDCLTGGGAEKAAASLCKGLFKEGYKVYIISMYNNMGYDYKGKLYTISETQEKQTLLNSLKLIFHFKKIYNKINADLYIDFRVKYNSKKEFLYHLFIFKPKKTILTIHSNKIANYLPQHNVFYEFYSKVKALIVVSEGILLTVQSKFAFKNLRYIPNFYSEDIIKQSEAFSPDIKPPYILAVGRLKNTVKQFDKLILSYKNSEPAKQNIPLIILGEGEDRELLEHLIKENQLEEKVKLLGFKQNPYPYIKACKFLVLTSKYEGFSMVLLESLALQIPVISFDCKAGPSEIIKNGENGLLVKDQDFEAFLEAINKMYLDVNFYEVCKSNCKISIKKYSKNEVLKIWKTLIDN